MLGYHWWQIGQAVWGGVLLFVANPLFYIASLLMLWELYRHSKQERKFFGTRISKVWNPWGIRLLQGFLIGFLLSVVSLLVGIAVTPWEIGFVSGLSLLFGLMRVRWMAPFYSVGVAIVIALAARLWEPTGLTAEIRGVWQHVQDFHVTQWLAVVAMAFLGQYLLLFWNRNARFAPAHVMGRRGKPIGAFLAQLGFVVPIVLISPGMLPVPQGVWSGWPWLGSGGGGLTLALVPLTVGFSGVFSTVAPKDGIRRIAWGSLLGVLVVGGFVYLSLRVSPWFAAGGAIVAMLFQALFTWTTHRVESLREPIFTAVDTGVRVLTTTQGSLAESMVLRAGEVITHVNQVPVHSVYDLHFALDQNPAYAKLQVVDSRGEVRMVGKPIYAGERTKLGLIPVPDGNRESAYSKRKGGLFQTVYLRLARVHPEKEASLAEASASPPVQ